MAGEFQPPGRSWPAGAGCQRRDPLDSTPLMAASACCRGHDVLEDLGRQARLRPGHLVKLGPLLARDGDLQGRDYAQHMTGAKGGKTGRRSCHSRSAVGERRGLTRSSRFGAARGSVGRADDCTQIIRFWASSPRGDQPRPPPALSSRRPGGPPVPRRQQPTGLVDRFAAGCGNWCGGWDPARR